MSSPAEYVGFDALVIGNQYRNLDPIYAQVAVPANWVEDYVRAAAEEFAKRGGGVPPSAPSLSGGQDSALPVLDIQNLPEIEVNAPRVPLVDLTNEELLEVGTDDALYELDARRGIPESQRMFNQPYVVNPYAPPSVWTGTVPTDYSKWKETFPPRDPPPKTPVRQRLNPLPIVGRILGGIFTLLTPQPMGPRRYDEAPYFPDLQPIPFELAPAPQIEIPLPRWFETPFPETVPYVPSPQRVPNPSPVRPVLPVGDYPGMLDDPFGNPLPDFPERISWPDADPTVRPDRPTPLPFPNPRTVTDVPDRRIDEPFSPFLDPINRPTGPGTPPRIQPPQPIPITLTPIDLDPFNPPQFQPQPFDIATPVDTRVADPCKCAPCDDGKKKKKKKKSEPRTVCYSGTFREYARGSSKKRLKEVPCAKVDKGSTPGSSILPALPFPF